MGLQKDILKQGIVQLMADMAKMDKTDHEQYADRLSTLIDAFVKSGQVVVLQGIPVATYGSATAQTGATTAQGSGIIV
ncbi:MAG: hypothetical protein WCO44_12380 [Bacteroidota bacterium]